VSGVLVQCLAQDRTVVEALRVFLAARGVHCAHGE
jgi:hypothetical protein